MLHSFLFSSFTTTPSPTLPPTLFPTPAPHQCCNEHGNRCREGAIPALMPNRGENVKFFTLTTAVPGNQGTFECEQTDDWGDDTYFNICVNAIVDGSGKQLANQCSAVSKNCQQLVVPIAPAASDVVKWTATFYCVKTIAGGKDVNWGGCYGSCAGASIRSGDALVA
tara:strand:+ start:33 stop:533 length:501 start_codon:yes stop_codon:yes gene_type:complete